MDAGDTLLTEDSTSTSEVARFDSDCSTNPLLKFMTTDEYELQTVRRQKSSRDPMSHRIIEKRRRDRMNNCLADLSRLIPTSYLKQGQGRIEKTEIIEMAIKHIRILQSQADNKSESKMPPSSLKDAMCGEGDGKTSEHSCCKKQFFLGFKECQDEVMRFLVEEEAMSATDPLCLRIIDHLNAAGRHFEVALNNETTKIQTETGGQLNMPSYYSGSLSRTLLSGSTIDPLLPLPPNPATAGIIGRACSLQDKHLCNLLSPQGLQEIESDQEYTHQSQGALPTGSVCCSEINVLGSQTVTVSQVTSHVPAFSGPSLGAEESICGGIISTENSLNGGVSSGYVSDVSCREKNQNASADHSGVASHLISCKENAINIYKFKHNITKRFSQEGKVILQHTYDGSSSTSSRECEEEVPGTCSLRHRSARGKSRYASTSDSGPYPSSDHSYSHERSKCFNSDVRISMKENSGNLVLEERSDRCKNQFCKGSNHSITFMGQKFEQCTRSALPLPGFVLHPSGTHYMPMSVCYANFPDIFETMETTPGPPVFHPISIPVHFHGPVISLPTNVCSRSEDTAECLKISADPDVKHYEVKDTKGIRK